MIQSRFLLLRDTPEFMYIIDIGTHEKSVTNDVENVLKHLSQYLNLGTRRLIYRDSQGNNDEILHENAIFKGFKPGHKGIELFEIIQNRKK